MNVLRFALRNLAKSPGFSATAIIILGVGIGASTAIFSVVYALLLRPLAYHDATRLVQVQLAHPEQGVSTLAPATFEAVARERDTFAAIAAQQYYYVNLTKTDTPARLTVVQATADYFQLFGVAPLLGRTWSAAEAKIGAAPVAVLSESLWRTRFNARAGILGEQVMLDDVPATVIGIMPASFTDPWGNAQLWRPLPQTGKEASDHSGRNWSTFARLKPGVSARQADAVLATLAARLAAEQPDNYRGWTLNVADLQGLIVGNYRTGLLVVLGAVACVMLITCANVAGLAIVRAIGRRKELAVRAALGASGRQLIGQLLGESLVLSLLGGALGVLLANWGVSAILTLVGNGWLPRAGEIAINLPVLLAALALSLVTGLLFGLASAWGAARTDANEALKDNSGRASGSPVARRLRAGLVIAEIAVALMLLVGASLLGRSFHTLLQRNPGIRTDHLLTLGVSLPAKRYDSPDKARAFYLRAEEAVQAVPGVVAAGFSQTMPFTWGNTATLIPVGDSLVTEQNAPGAFYDSVGVQFFRAAGISLVAGRTFVPSDAPGAPEVVVISAATARRFFGDENPLGRRLRSGNPAQKAQFEIVGVVGDVLRAGLAVNEPPLQIYRPLAQRPPWFATLLVQTGVDPASAAKSVQQAIWSVDPDQAIEAITPVSALISNSVTQPRLYLVLFGLFATISLGLAAIGLYGLVAYGVAQRTREFGIRTALGASRGDVLRLVMREGLGLLGLGLALGLSGAGVSVRVLQSMIYSTSLHDPVVFAGVPLMLAAVTLLACWLPARRATKVDPLEALRSE